ERARHGDVADVAAGDLHLPGQQPQVQAGVARGLGRPDPLPDAAALVHAGHGELHGRVQPAYERVVHVPAEVGRQDDDALVLLHPLEQVADLDVGVAVV